MSFEERAVVAEAKSPFSTSATETPRSARSRADAGAGHAAADDDDVVLGVGQRPGPRRAGLSRQAR